MSLTEKVLQTSDTKLNTSNKTTLNPNAVEFIPFSLRSPSPGNTGSFNATKLVASSSTVGKVGLGRSESSTSRHSEEEAHQYWQDQLPDDITPDFKVPAEDDDPQALGSLSLAGLSLHGNHETPGFPTSAAGGYAFLDHPQFLASGNSLSENIRYSTSTYGEDPARTSFSHQAQKPWDNQIGLNDQLLSGNLDGHPYRGISRHGLINDMINESSTMGDVDMNPVELLAAQFPGFAAESLAEVYFANGCDLHLTIDMLTQLELQIDGGLDQNMNSKTLPAPSLGALDFPALTASDSLDSSAKYGTRDGFQQTGSPYQSAGNDNMLFFKSSSSAPSRGSLDFATAVRKLASQDSGVWKLERNGSVEPSVGSSRSSNDLASAYSTSMQGKSVFGERFQNRGSARSVPVWVETGDAVANMYSELREEARDHARLRNAYFEQARQAYLIGNKALAKELSAKGQLHNMHMKDAHGKAQEAIFRQRNPVDPENVRGNERMIDLHGLHVSEAIHVLKHKLNLVRGMARAADQRLQVYICVGTGHHTRGSRTPARLPVAVQRYLLEEGLDFTEPQPGLLRVVIY